MLHNSVKHKLLKKIFFNMLQLQRETSWRIVYLLIILCMWTDKVAQLSGYNCPFYVLDKTLYHIFII